MSSTLFSFVIWCRHDAETGALQVRVVDVGTSKDVLFKDDSFLLKVFVDESASAGPRCFLRHISSGREVYLQSGSNFLPFVKGCLIADEETEDNETHK